MIYPDVILWNLQQGAKHISLPISPLSTYTQESALEIGHFKSYILLTFSAILPVNMLILTNEILSTEFLDF